MTPGTGAPFASRSTPRTVTMSYAVTVRGVAVNDVIDVAILATRCAAGVDRRGVLVSDTDTVFAPAESNVTSNEQTAPGRP